MIAKKLMDCLAANIIEPDQTATTKKPMSTDTVYQFKITLLESHPPIWRRIQVQDCTLDRATKVMRKGLPDWRKEAW